MFVSRLQKGRHLTQGRAGGSVLYSVFKHFSRGTGPVTRGFLLGYTYRLCILSGNQVKMLALSVLSLAALAVASPIRSAQDYASALRHVARRRFSRVILFKYSADT